MIVDLRSDTVTKPSKEMRAYMMDAEVGDDVFGEDETIHTLENRLKTYFGCDDALFVPTATMANQIAIKIVTKPLDEIICDRYAHVYNYEVGGFAFHSGCSVRYIEGDRGVFTASDVLKNINPADVHKPITSLVCLENTVNRGGGKIYPLHILKEIQAVCSEHTIKMHLDGSRVFNALLETHDDATEYGKLFDTISICLSKGLGCPVGALLIGKKEYMDQARRVRKVFGGGMRQAGILAAAGIYALDNNIQRLKDDHILAKNIERVLNALPYIDHVLPVETNIIIFKLRELFDTDAFIQHLAAHAIKAFAIGENNVRFVTHMDVNNSMMHQIEQALLSFK